jgi:hypothetical protein
MVHLSLSTEALLGQVVVVSTITTMKFANSNKICRRAETISGYCGIHGRIVLK